MSTLLKKHDLRITRTRTVLQQALSDCLEQRTFRRITVTDLCKAANVSRATFYDHYADKYDLLRSVMKKLKSSLIDRQYDYQQIEALANQFISEHEKMIANLLDDADRETTDMLLEFMAELLGFPARKDRDEMPAHIVLHNFSAGGMVNLLMWQAKNKFPHGLPMFNPHLKQVLCCLLNTVRVERENECEYYTI